MSKRVLSAILLSSAFCFAVPANAQAVGSTSLATHRNCTAPGDPCGGGLPGQQIVNRTYGGGVGVGGFNGLDIGGGNVAWSDVTFGVSDLPVIRAYTAAPGNVRMNINVFGFQSFTYMGAAPAAFSIDGFLHLVNSSVSGPDGVDGGGNPVPGGQYAGGSIFSQYVGIWDPAILTGLMTPEQLFTQLFYAPCGTAGVLAAGNGGGSLSGGDQNYSVTTSSCGGGLLMLAPGQEVLVVAGIQLPVNRGGFADSTATFTTAFDDALGLDTIDNLNNNLSSALDRGANLVLQSPVPEPATWLMMIMGFFGIGGMMRLRRRGGKLAAA